ncbi:MAG: J domain-containing protein, partial [Gemmatimonadota bacterium]
MTRKFNPYRVLGVSRDADVTSIRAAFRRLALRHHPDRNPGSRESEERFKTIVAAYEILTDPGLRKRWNRRTGAPRRRAGFPDVGFHDSFHRPGGFDVPSRPGHDVNLRIELA